jgi:hypothetical protein
MGVEAALGDFQRLGQFINGTLPLHGLHDAEPCGGILADKMPQAFFKDLALATQIIVFLSQPPQLALLGRLGGQRPWLA